MSKHVWLTRPSKQKAVKLLQAFKMVLSMGFTPRQARRFAGYWTERNAQGMRTWSYSDLKGFALISNTLLELANGAVRSGHKYADGKNGDGYELAFNNHLSFWLGPLADSVGLSREVPPLVLADKLEEVERYEDAMLVRQMVVS